MRWKASAAKAAVGMAMLASNWAYAQTPPAPQDQPLQQNNVQPAPGAAATDAEPAETLNDALAAAYEHNPTLMAARLSARAADEQTAQARAHYLPSLNVNASAGAQQSDTNSVPNRDLNPSAVSVVANQSLYTGGLRNATSQLARANV